MTETPHAGIPSGAFPLEKMLIVCGHSKALDPWDSSSLPSAGHLSHVGAGRHPRERDHHIPSCHPAPVRLHGVLEEFSMLSAARSPSCTQSVMSSVYVFKILSGRETKKKKSLERIAIIYWGFKESCPEDEAINIHNKSCFAGSW